MLQPIIEGLTSPFWEWYNGYTDLSILAQLHQREKLSREDIKALQFKKLKKLLIHAYRTVPFYRERFDACGFSAEAFSDNSELRGIPVLNKTDINNNETTLSSKYEKKNLIAGSTSGSTGIPLNF